MRATQTFLATEKYPPNDAELVSHQLMIRAGMMRKLAAGIYTWLPSGLKVMHKIEAIVREEMNRSGAAEMLMPSVLPAELIQESGRWEKFGPELLKFPDRHKRSFCYGPTHEEIITDIARRELRSYKQLPLNVYQIQTKFRDEVRPRYGIMRGREFVMKDAYSFHTTFESLKATYAQMYQTYCRILARMGLAFRSVQADSGAIGGDESCEFQVLAQAGEDVICYAEGGDYAANLELASYAKPDIATRPAPQAALERVDTPGVTTIAELAEYLAVPASQTVKTLVIKNAGGEFYMLALRGDHQLNEVKVARLETIGGAFDFATAQEVRDLFGADAGSLGPVCSPLPLIVDYSAAMLTDFVCGANATDQHFRGVDWARDVADYTLADLREVVAGDRSPDGKPLNFQRGIEIGHIFQLGTHYSEKMQATVLDEHGKSQPLIMGCYGFGLSRAVAAAIEQWHDDRGILWPQAIAPYEVVIVPMMLHKSPEVREAAEQLYADLVEAGYDVLFDDRNERPGVMFADADLIGIPHRLVVAPKGLARGMVEYKARHENEVTQWPLEEALPRLKQAYQANADSS